MNVKNLLEADAARYGCRRSPRIRLVKLALHNPGFLAVVCLRLQSKAAERGRHRRAALYRHVALTLTGADFCVGVQVGPGLLLPHPTGVVLGKGATVGAGCTILQNVTLGERYADGRGPHHYPCVEDGATIGAGACVLGDVRIGAGAVVGANSVVTTEVPAGSTAVGAPARVVGAPASCPHSGAEGGLAG